MTVFVLYGISFRTYGQSSYDSLLVNYIKLIDSVKLKLDTTCSDSLFSYNDFDSSYKCGKIKNKIRIGKWVSFDSEGSPVSIKYFTEKGMDSLFIGLVNNGKTVQSISIKSPTIWASFYQDYLETLSWEISDTTRIEYYFYPGGGIKKFGEIYLPNLKFLKKQLPFDEGRGKNGLWTYFDENGIVLKTETWNKGILVE